MCFFDGLEQDGHVGGGLTFVQPHQLTDNFECKRHILYGGTLLITEQIVEIREQLEFHRLKQVGFVLLVRIQIAGFLQIFEELLKRVADVRGGRVEAFRNLFVRQFLADTQLEGAGVVEFDVLLLRDLVRERGNLGLRDGSIVWLEVGTHWREIALRPVEVKMA